MQLKTARAVRWRDDFNEFYNKTSTEGRGVPEASVLVASRSPLEPVTVSH